MGTRSFFTVVVREGAWGGHSPQLEALPQMPPVITKNGKNRQFSANFCIIVLSPMHRRTLPSHANLNFCFAGAITVLLTSQCLHQNTLTMLTFIRYLNVSHDTVLRLQTIRLTDAWSYGLVLNLVYTLGHIISASVRRYRIERFIDILVLICKMIHTCHAINKI